jgi:hypothetical protein
MEKNAIYRIKRARVVACPGSILALGDLFLIRTCMLDCYFKILVCPALSACECMRLVASLLIPFFLMSYSVGFSTYREYIAKLDIYSLFETIIRQ